MYLFLLRLIVIERDTYVRLSSIVAGFCVFVCQSFQHSEHQLGMVAKAGPSRGQPKLRK